VPVQVAVRSSLGKDEKKHPAPFLVMQDRSPDNDVTLGGKIDSKNPASIRSRSCISQKIQKRNSDRVKGARSQRGQEKVSGVAGDFKNESHEEQGRRKKVGGDTLAQWGRRRVAQGG